MHFAPTNISLIRFTDMKSAMILHIFTSRLYINFLDVDIESKFDIFVGTREKYPNQSAKIKLQQRCIISDFEKLQ